MGNTLADRNFIKTFNSVSQGQTRTPSEAPGESDGIQNVSDKRSSKSGENTENTPVEAMVAQAMPGKRQPKSLKD